MCQYKEVCQIGYLLVLIAYEDVHYHVHLGMQPAILRRRVNTSAHYGSTTVVLVPVWGTTVVVR